MITVNQPNPTRFGISKKKATSSDTIYCHPSIPANLFLIIDSSFNKHISYQLI